MSRPVPSRQTLRHLARLCIGEQLTASSRPLRAARHARPPSPHSLRQLTTSRPFSQTHSSHKETINPPSSLPDTSSYYTLFPSTLATGPPPAGTFSIPLPQLRREFLRLQGLYHPDKYPSNPEGTSLSANNLIALSSLINNAYKTLSDPLLRAQYLLLQTYGIDVTSEDNSANTTDPTTLMEVMEAQEIIESASSQKEIDTLKSENQVRIDEAGTKMARAFEEGDLDNARRECIRLKYWRSLQDGLESWEEGKEVRLIH